MLDPNRQYTFFSGEVAKLDLDKTYTFGPDTEKLYNPSGPDLIDTGMIIGLEVVPAIVGGLVGSFAGPKVVQVVQRLETICRKINESTVVSKRILEWRNSERQPY